MTIISKGAREDRRTTTSVGRTHVVATRAIFLTQLCIHISSRNIMALLQKEPIMHSFTQVEAEEGREKKNLTTKAQTWFRLSNSRTSIKIQTSISHSLAKSSLQKCSILKASCLARYTSLWSPGKLIRYLVHKVLRVITFLHSTGIPTSHAKKINSSM